jgi:hypothetical protein
MSKLFKITFCTLSILLSNITLSETVITRTWSIPEHSIEEAAPQITSDETIVVNSSVDCDNFTIILYDNKLKIYYGHPEIELEELEDIQELLDEIEKKEISPTHFDSTDPIFHRPVVKFDEIYYSNSKNCFINAKKSITIDEESILECPHIVLKSSEIDIQGAFLIDTKTVELQSNKPISLLSSIKFTIKDKANYKLQPFIASFIDFKDNFAVIACLSADKVELRCLPGSFYLDGNTICFK